MVNCGGAALSMCAGTSLACVTAGEPRKALTLRRLSLKTNALAPALHATYCPPSEAGQARCTSGTNDAMISIGRMASTSSSMITAGLSIDAKTVCFTVNVSYA